MISDLKSLLYERNEISERAPVSLFARSLFLCDENYVAARFLSHRNTWFQLLEQQVFAPEVAPAAAAGERGSAHASGAGGVVRLLECKAGDFCLTRARATKSHLHWPLARHSPTERPVQMHARAPSRRSGLARGSARIFARNDARNLPAQIGLASS